ncbi:hypothetical protein ACIPJS_24485 [Streptomyces sp. NPDC086783]|uniref:hypothetical protein n=1 Tax=Streptomyces sp. NPDC086783 TaxID=3365758 RepID=UPI00380964AD
MTPFETGLWRVAVHDDYEITDAHTLRMAVNRALQATGHPGMSFAEQTRLLSDMGYPLHHIRNANGHKTWQAFEHLRLTKEYTHD